MRNPRNEPLGSGTSRKSGGGKEAPERRCVLSGVSSARDALVRLALSSDGLVLPDAHGKAPGRGAWIGVNKAALAAALANGRLKGALARAFKTGLLTIPEDLPDLVEAALRQALAQRLGLELRSGKLILGSDRIASEARMGRLAALYHASDASDDGVRKLDQAWRVGGDAQGSGRTGIRLPLDREALSVALGRENVVHLALADHASAQRVAVPLHRLETFIGACGDAAAGSCDAACDAATAN
ncbi:MAG: DUF448 domain-containing protein [Alteraurantiacibacter sp.]|nr:DUF448 domain-containing protein [Alteraurantiacibacter sp.]